MIDIELLQRELNNEATKLLSMIKSDYYEYFSNQKREVIDSLLRTGDVVVVNNGAYEKNPTLLGHGGRSLNDGKIHFYPDGRNFESYEEAFENCSRILIHELFHFFIQPDICIPKGDERIELAVFYTEGLVERETRNFVKNHPEVIYQNALYGHNIKFANMVEAKLGANNYEMLFGESDYLKNIGGFKDYYKELIEAKNRDLTNISKLIKELPLDDAKSFYKRVAGEYLQTGNVEEVIAKLKLLKKEYGEENGAKTEIDE